MTNFNLIIDNSDENLNFEFIKQRYASLKKGGTYILFFTDLDNYTEVKSILSQYFKKKIRLIQNNMKPLKNIRCYLPHNIDLWAFVCVKGTKATLNKLGDADLIHYAENSFESLVDKIIKRHSHIGDCVLKFGSGKEIHKSIQSIPINKQDITAPPDIMSADTPIPKNDKIKPNKAISLFSGMGGDSQGIVNAGVELLAYSEWEKDMRDTHELNFPDTKLIGCGDITKTPNDEFLKYRGIVDIIFAGFPCQGFSNAGNKDPNDPRNSLFREFVRSTELIKPKYIIGENVKGLLKRKTAKGEEYINIIESEFNRIGYNIYYKVYMCSKLDINVPQNRERLIIVGIRRDLNKIFTFPEDNKIRGGDLKSIIKFTMDGTLKLKPEYLDFDFNDIPKDCIISDMDNDDDERDPHPNLVQYAKKRDYVRKDVHRPHRLHFGRRLDVGGEIIDIRKPINTIICSYAHCPRFFIPQKNKNGNYLRCLTPDELKQCQGFPSNYRISGNISKKIKQIGNAVPPPLIEMIVKELIKL